MRRTLITGITSGIGAAIGECFQRQGYSVIGMQRRSPGVQIDLSDLLALPAAWNEVVAHFGGPPDVVIINACRNVGGPFHGIDNHEFLNFVNLAFVSPLLLAQIVLRSWVAENKPGHLLFIGSQAALPGARQSGNVLYTACKAGLHGVVGPLATEYGPRVRVNAIAPGDVDTPLTTRCLERKSLESGFPEKDLRKELAESSPLRRLVNAEEVAEAALFLDRCEAMNGAIINISAGRSAH